MSETTLIANGTIVTADGEFAGDVLIDGETIAAVGRVDAPDGATVIDADGLLRPAGPDRQPHASVDAVHGDDVLGRLRHRHAGRRRRRRHVPGRLRHPARAGHAAVGARGVVGPRRRRRARRLRVSHGDHQRQRAGARRHDGDGRRRDLLVQAVHGLQGRADGARRRADGVHGAGARPQRSHDGACRERGHHRSPRHPRAGPWRHLGDPSCPDAPGVRRGGGHLPGGADRGDASAPGCSSCT